MKFYVVFLCKIKIKMNNFLFLNKINNKMCKSLNQKKNYRIENYLKYVLFIQNFE